MDVKELRDEARFGSKGYVIVTSKDALALLDVVEAAQAFVVQPECTCTDSYRIRSMLSDPQCTYHEMETEFDALRAALSRLEEA